MHIFILVRYFIIYLFTYSTCSQPTQVRDQGYFLVPQKLASKLCVCVLQNKLQKDLLKICHGSTNPDCQVAVATKLFTANIFGFSVRKVLHVPLPEP